MASQVLYTCIDWKEEKKMFYSVAYYAYEREQWHIVIGRYDTIQAAHKAILEHAAKHETDVNLQYYQIQEKA